MSISRLFLGLLLVGLTSSIAMADSSDPRMGLIGGTNSEIINPTNLGDFQFSFTRNGDSNTIDCGTKGGPSEDVCIDPAFTSFINHTGQTWSSITLTFTQPQNQGLTFTLLENADALDPYFTSSTQGIDANNNPFVTFFGIDATHPGIQSAFAESCNDGPHTCDGPTANDGTLLLYDFAILGDVSDMGNGQTFAAQGTFTTVSEPSTVLLALAGGFALLFLKRR
jgi:hypothetical protein